MSHDIDERKRSDSVSEIETYRIVTDTPGGKRPVNETNNLRKYLNKYNYLHIFSKISWDLNFKLGGFMIEGIYKPLYYLLDQKELSKTRPPLGCLYMDISETIDLFQLQTK